jgi:hypothetical protein
MAKTTLTVDVRYDARRTDPEALACAMDRLMESVLSTPDIMLEYGNPTVEEFFVADIAASKRHGYVLRIDGGLLRKQRLLLLKLFDAARGNVPSLPRAEHDTDLLEGILSLLDEIADQAHDNHGIDCLLNDEADQPEGKTQNRGQ